MLIIPETSKESPSPPDPIRKIVHLRVLCQGDFLGFQAGPWHLLELPVLCKEIHLPGLCPFRGGSVRVVI